MKKFLVFILFTTFIIFLLLRNKIENQNTRLQSSSHPPTPSPSMNINAKTRYLEKKDLQIGSPRSLATHSDIKAYLPFKFPPSLNNRWEQKIAYEDDRYITSQLYLDERPLNDYFFKWKKQGTELSLVAGELPEIKSLAASFPSKNTQSEKITDILQDKASLLSSKEIWILNSKGVLLPFLKIEIQLNEKPKRTNGHEYWIYDLLKDSVTKIIQVHRY